MRRDWRGQLPQSMFRGAEPMRLVAGIFMLVLICMLMVRFRDPGMWRWLVPETPAVSGEPKPQRPERLPSATGPTDEDRDQAEKVAEEFQAITEVFVPSVNRFHGFVTRPVRGRMAGCRDCRSMVMRR